MTAPRISDLSWTEIKPGVFTATPDEGFWDLWRTDKDLAKSIGLRVGQGAHGWQVTFTAGVVPPEEVTIGMMLLRTKLHDRLNEMSDSERAARQRRLDWEAGAPERERQMIERRQADLIHAAEMEAKRKASVRQAQKDAMEILERWQGFTVRSARLRALAAMPDLTDKQLVEIGKIAAATAAKAMVRQRELEGRTAADPVDWSDSMVAAAMVHLTTCDGDHASVANGKGWDAGDSANGHLINALLSSDRAAAIRIGRGMVGKYVRQLCEANPAWAARIHAGERA